MEESAPRAVRSGSGIDAARLAARLLEHEDRAFLDALREAGLMGEVDAEELLRLASEASEGDSEERCATMLELYYTAGGDPSVSARRRRADRFFMHRVDQAATAVSLVARLVELVPEIGNARLERIGGAAGPLVLRSGDYVAAVDDDEDDELPDRREDGVETVSVRGIVRALNVLLERHGVRERLIALRGDGEREMYAALGVRQALQLARAGCLEDRDAEDVLELGAW